MPTTRGTKILQLAIAKKFNGVVVNMGDAKRRKEIALQRNPEYNSDPVVKWTEDDKQRFKSTFGKFLEPDFLKELTRSGFKQMGRGAVGLSFFAGRPSAEYVPASTFLLILHESGFKNRLQKALEEYHPET